MKKTMTLCACVLGLWACTETPPAEPVVILVPMEDASADVTPVDDDMGEDAGMDMLEERPVRVIEERAFWSERQARNYVLDPRFHMIHGEFGDAEWDHYLRSPRGFLGARLGRKVFSEVPVRGEPVLWAPSAQQFSPGTTRRVDGNVTFPTEEVEVSLWVGRKRAQLPGTAGDWPKVEVYAAPLDQAPGVSETRYYEMSYDEEQEVFERGAFVWRRYEVTLSALGRGRLRVSDATNLEYFLHAPSVRATSGED